MTDAAGELDWAGQPGNIEAKKKLSKKLWEDGEYIKARMVLVSPYLSAATRGGIFNKLKYGLLTYWQVRMTIGELRVQDESLYYFSTDELDVLATALRKLPWPLRDLKLAKDCISAGLDSEHQDNDRNITLPHTRALLYIGLAEVEEKRGAMMWYVAGYYDSALELRSKIFSEPDILMAERQWVRIAYALGAWYYRHGEIERAKSLMEEILPLSLRVAPDQYNKKVVPWMASHGMLP